MNLELTTLLNDFLSHVCVANTNVKYIYTDLTKIGKKIRKEYPDLMDEKTKDFKIKFNEFSDLTHFESKLNFLINRISYLVKDGFTDKEYYLKLLKKSFNQIEILNKKREVLFKRNDLTEQICPDSHYWIDEVDSMTLLYKERNISKFIKVQYEAIHEVINLLRVNVVSTIEDLIPDIEKRNHLKKWLVENDYCDDNFKWLKGGSGHKRKLGCLLKFVIPHKNFTDLTPSVKELINVGKESFGLKITDNTLRAGSESIEDRKGFDNLKL